jgi:hypothetical protein
MVRSALALLLLGSVAAACALQSSSAGDDKKTEKKRKPRFTIGKDTTVVSGPVDAHGHIDYMTALNHRLRKDLTPDQNANVLLWKAFGPHPEGAKMPPEFFKWMGIPAPPEKGEYFQHIKPGPDEAADQLLEEQDEARQRPWKSAQLPRVAAWLKTNEVPLRLVLEATKRTGYYSPMASGDPNGGPGRMIACLLPGIQKSREFTQALTARAMLAIGEERYDDAWQDLLACHRLGRLISRGSTLIELLVGIAIDTIASHADLAYLDNPKLNAKQIKACLAELQALPPMAPVADKIDLGERYMMLDIVMAIDRNGVEYLQSISDSIRFAPPEELAKPFLHDIDWDPAMRGANRWYDRLAAAMRAKDRATRNKPLDEIDGELQQLKADLADGDLIKAALAPGKTAQDRGKLAGDILAVLLLPAVRKVQTAADRSEQTQQNLHLAFSLAAYQRDKGEYPAKLDTLAPAYLAKIPSDIFSGKALIYRPDKKGYLLYSVGMNGLDDGGRSYDDDPPGDDLVIRMPQPARRNP